MIAFTGLTTLPASVVHERKPRRFGGISRVSASQNPSREHISNDIVPIRIEGHRDLLPSLIVPAYVGPPPRHETTRQEWRLDLFVNIGYEQVVHSPFRTARSDE